MKRQHLESEEDGLLNYSWEGNAVIISCSLVWLITSSVISTHPLFFTWIKVVPGGFSANIWPLEAKRKGSKGWWWWGVSSLRPDNIPWECLIETVMSSGRRSLEHRRLVAINPALATKESVRLLMERTCLREIKSGGVTAVLSYQDLMAASQDKCTSLN